MSNGCMRAGTLSGPQKEEEAEGPTVWLLFLEAGGRF